MKRKNDHIRSFIGVYQASRYLLNKSTKLHWLPNINQEYAPNICSVVLTKSVNTINKLLPQHWMLWYSNWSPLWTVSHLPKARESFRGISLSLWVRKLELKNGVAPSEPSKGIPSVVVTLAETVRDLRKRHKSMAEEFPTMKGDTLFKSKGEFSSQNRNVERKGSQCLRMLRNNSCFFKL